MKRFYTTALYLCLLTRVSLAEEILTGETLFAEARGTSEKIRQIVSERGKDLLILAKCLTSFAQSGRQEWAKNIVSFYHGAKCYPLIRVINARGIEEIRVIYGRETKSGYSDVSEDDFFKESIELDKDQISVSSLEFNLEGIIVLRMSTVVYGLSSAEKAVLSFDWDIDEITSLIKKLKVSDSNYNFIIDPDGKILVHPDMNKMLKGKIDTDISPEYKTIVERMLLGENGWGEYTVQDEKYIVGFCFYPELDWSIGILKKK